MAYIDCVFYKEFGGKPIPAADFTRIAEIASDVIYGICRIKPDSEIEASPQFRQAVAYEVEMLYEQGGIDAIIGMSESSMSGGSESLGDYSISGGGAAQSALPTYNGIPVSSLALCKLRELGLMSRWAYAEFYRRRCYGKP